MASQHQTHRGDTYAPWVSSTTSRRLPGPSTWQASGSAAARRLRPTGNVHGGRSGNKSWLRLNFPTAEEEALAEGEGMPPTKKQKA